MMAELAIGEEDALRRRQVETPEALMASVTAYEKSKVTDILENNSSEFVTLLGCQV